jgi:DNA-binding response OmpR family regulator
MSNQPKILVLEDEIALLEAYVSYLNIDGCVADGLSSLEAAQNWLINHDFDILILDLGFNDGDGLAWLNKNQALQNKGLMIVTARDTIKDKIEGINAGADAYITKPVPLEIISATAHNLFKRIKKSPLPQWQINATNWMLTAPDRQSLKLTHSEMQLLLPFTKYHNQIIKRDQLIEELGHSTEYYDVRRLEIMIRRLRNKVLNSFGLTLPLETVHGQGFAFSAPISQVD